MVSLFFVHIVFAIPNPAPIYCENMGYVSNGTHCVFDDGESCELWAFYNGECGQDYVKELPCKQIGESVPPGYECCEGLTTVPNCFEEGDICSCTVGGWSFCASCGNSVCDEKYENICNCPEDCEECTSDSDCPSETKKYCDGNNACSSTTSYRCDNGKCVASTVSAGCKPCSNGCQDGACISEQCRDENYPCTPENIPCCEGLKEVSLAVEENGQCIAANCGSICRLCGNGVCDANENKCNCREDCEDLKAIKEYAVITKEDSEFYELARYFAEKKNANLIVYKKNFDEVIPLLSKLSPKYLAIVLSPEDLTPNFMDYANERLRELDNDLFLDVAYGYITSFTLEDGYEYVNKILDYSVPENLNVYGINPNYKFQELETEYGLNLFWRCTSNFGFTVCSDELRATVDRIKEEISDKNLIILALHGSPSSMILDYETLKGSLNGIIGKKATDESVLITSNSSLTLAQSCTTTKLEKTNINSSLVLAFLKSGTLSYIGARDIANTAVVPQETLISESILQGVPLGTSLKNFKNRYVFNKILGNKTLEGHPRVNETVLDWIEHNLKIWTLFGDPSIKISKEEITPNECIRNYIESSHTEKINGEDYLIKNVEIYIKFEDEGKTIANSQLISDFDEGGVIGTSACALNIPLENELVNYTVSAEGINERYESYFSEDNIIENAGDELIVLIPAYVGKGGLYSSIKLSFSIFMKVSLEPTECALSLCDCKCYIKGTSPHEGKLCGINCWDVYNISGCVFKDEQCEVVYKDEKEKQPIAEEKIEAIIGTKKIIIEKSTPNQLSIKTEKAVAVTSEKLVIEESKLYLMTSVGNKQIKILPEEASELTELTTVKNIELKEEATKPVYSLKGTKQVKILFIIPISMGVEVKVDAETSEIISISKPWWSFLAW